MTSRNPVALTAMHHLHVALGATMVESDGWQRPARYTSVEDEIGRVRQAVGLCDVSPVGKLNLQGEDIDSLLAATMDGIGHVEIGRVGEGRLKRGERDQDVVVARLARDEVLLLTAPGQGASVSRSLGQALAGCAHVVDITSALAGVKIVGPQAHRLLAHVTEVDTSPATFPNMSCAQGMVAEIRGTLLRRDIGRLLSYELLFGREFGEYMWDVLLESGEEYGAAPFGIEALARLR